MTDKILVSRKEIEALQKHRKADGKYYVDIESIRALLDKAAISQVEPVGYTSKKWVESVSDYCSGVYWKNSSTYLDEEYTVPIYTSPPAKSEKIAELTAKVKELEEYIEIDCRQVIQNFQESDIKLTAKCEKMREALNEIKYHINYQDTDELIVKIIDEVLEGIK